MGNDHEIIPFFSKRINFKEINTEFEEIHDAAQKCRSAIELRDLIDPVVEKIIARYEHLLDAEEYVEGEFAGLIFILVKLINTLVPEKLGIKVTVHSSGQKVIFVPLTRHDLVN